MIVGIPKGKVPLNPISHERVLVVEGNDDAYLMEEVLTNLMKHGSDDFEIRQIVGDNIHRDLPVLLKDPKFDSVRSFGVIWDADNDPDLAFRKIIGLLQSKAVLPIPQRPGKMARNERMAVGVCLVPGDGPGRLEDLFLRSQATHVAMPCVNKYIECLNGVLCHKGPNAPKETKIPYFPKDDLKARCLALLAAMYDTMPQIGIAAQKHYWNLNHECFTTLKTFLQEWMH